MNTYQHTFPTRQPDYADDEIDLLELCATLWRGKWLIMATLAIGLIPVIIWLKYQAPVYQVEALLDSTSVYDIQALQPTVLDDEGKRYQVAPLQQDAFYTALITQAGALHTQRLFWESWSKQPLSTDPRTGVSDNDRQFRRFFNALTLTPPNPKKPESTLSHLSLETTEPAQGVTLLSAYVDFLNARVVEQFVMQLEKGYASSLQQLTFDYNALQNREQQKLRDELIQLQEARRVAQSLKIIETPYAQLAGVELKVVDDRQYLLGTRVLTEEINALQARQDNPLSAFVPELRTMEYWRDIMENDLNKLHAVKADIQAFELASPAVSSLDPVKPRKMLILLAAVVMSGMVGVVLVFVMQGIKAYRARADV